MRSDNPDGADTQQPDHAAIAKQLLGSLRDRTGQADLEYDDQPSQITGGREAITYGFSLSDPPEDLSGKLILRLFSQQGHSDQGPREAAFQNSLTDLSYPVPRVVASFGASSLAGTQGGIDGRSFNIMQRIAGAPMMDGASLDPATIEHMIDWLANIHARLHKVPSAPVIEAVAKAGFPQDQFSFGRRLDYLGAYYQDDTFSGLRPVFDWLIANKPSEQESPVVCHGDFHPGNIMVQGDKVTGVIDWPGAAFADPEHDVATTLILIKAGAGELEEEIRPMIQQIADLYLQRYTAISPLSLEKVDYYEVMRSFRAFTRGTAQHMPGLAPELAPRDEYPWAGEFALHSLHARLKQITGIDLPLPASM